jgi:hypothetical protein
MLSQHSTERTGMLAGLKPIPGPLLQDVRSSVINDRDLDNARDLLCARVLRISQ